MSLDGTERSYMGHQKGMALELGNWDVQGRSATSRLWTVIWRGVSFSAQNMGFWRQINPGLKTGPVTTAI